MSLEGQVAFITGASRGIGRALAVALAQRGCDVVVTAKTETPDRRLPGTIGDTAREVEATGRRALAIRLDVRDEAAVQAAVDRAMETFGRIDILCNNAGAIQLSPVLETTPKRFDLLMGVNARGAFVCSRAVLPHMIARRYGHILMMSPPGHADRMPGRAVYTLSKYGMTFLALSIAEEAREHNVAANALWPVTAIETQATKHFWPGQESMWRTPAILVDAAIAIFEQAPAACTGRALYDEEVLRAAGVKDFGKYAVVPGAEPPPWSRDLVGGGST